MDEILTLKVRSRWRFKHSDLDLWIESQKVIPHRNGEAKWR
jgi:hypothetical protein